MKCKSRGFPEPSYTITLNGTKTVSTEETYTINEVKWNDIGTYNCTATNEHGSDSAAEFLDVASKKNNISRHIFFSILSPGKMHVNMRQARAINSRANSTVENLKK